MEILLEALNTQSIPDTINKDELEKPSSHEEGFLLQSAASFSAEIWKSVNEKGRNMGNNDVDSKQYDHESVSEWRKAFCCVKVEENPH